MSIFVEATLPNPQSSTDPQWNEWNKFLIAEQIQTCDESVVRRYQCLDDQSTDLLSDDRVNHLLTLSAEGPISNYADEAEDQCGRDFDPDEMDSLEKTLNAFDSIFSKKGYRFCKNSVVYKGVSTKPYYTIHRFDTIVVDEIVRFHGFLSTSVCREKGEAFCRTHGVLLIIKGLDKVDCIVPENKQVRTTPAYEIPEHEVLLNCGTKMVVRDVSPGGSLPNKVVVLEVV